MKRRKTREVLTPIFIEKAEGLYYPLFIPVRNAGKLLAVEFQLSDKVEVDKRKIILKVKEKEKTPSYIA